METQVNVYSHVAIKDHMKFIFSFLFSRSNKVKVLHTNIEDWIKQQLDDTLSEMTLVAGELAIGIKSKEIVEKFKTSVRGGKKINIFCGPRIYIENNTNDLYNFLLVEHNNFKNLKVYGAKESLSNMPLFHFIINGRNVCIERPHLPSEAMGDELKTSFISNSILWYNRLKILFKNLVQNGTDDIASLKLNDKEQLKEYENSLAYKPLKEKILLAIEYSNHESKSRNNN